MLKVSFNDVILLRMKLVQANRYIYFNVSILDRLRIPNQISRSINERQIMILFIDISLSPQHQSFYIIINILI